MGYYPISILTLKVEEKIEKQKQIMRGDTISLILLLTCPLSFYSHTSTLASAKQQVQTADGSRGSHRHTHLHWLHESQFERWPAASRFVSWGGRAEGFFEQSGYF